MEVIEEEWIKELIYLLSFHQTLIHFSEIEIVEGNEFTFTMTYYPEKFKI